MIPTMPLTKFQTANASALEFTMTTVENDLLPSARAGRRHVAREAADRVLSNRYGVSVSSASVVLFDHITGDTVLCGAGERDRFVCDSRLTTYAPQKHSSQVARLF